MIHPIIHTTALEKQLKDYIASKSGVNEQLNFLLDHTLNKMNYDEIWTIFELYYEMVNHINYFYNNPANNSRAIYMARTFNTIFEVEDESYLNEIVKEIYIEQINYWLISPEFIDWRGNDDRHVVINEFDHIIKEKRELFQSTINYELKDYFSRKKADNERIEKVKKMLEDYDNGLQPDNLFVNSSGTYIHDGTYDNLD